MKFSIVSALCLLVTAATANVVKRAAQFTQGQPIDGNGKGGPILGKNSFDMLRSLILRMIWRGISELPDFYRS